MDNGAVPGGTSPLSDSGAVPGGSAIRGGIAVEYLIVGLIAWFGASVLVAATWSLFYSRVVPDHPILDSPPRVQGSRHAAHQHQPLPTPSARASTDLPPTTSISTVR